MLKIKSVLNIFGLRLILNIFWFCKSVIQFKLGSIYFLGLPSVRISGKILIGENIKIGSNFKLTVPKNSIFVIRSGSVIGNNVSITVAPGKKIEFGEKVRINDYCMFSGHIEVGDRSIFSAFATIVSDSHRLDDDLPIDEADAILGLLEGQVKVLNDSFVGIKASILGDTELKVRGVVPANVAIINYRGDKRVVGGIKRSARNL